jgi:hypothetical protein
MKNVSSTLCLKNVATLFKKILQYFVINNYEMGWLKNNKQQV